MIEKLRARSRELELQHLAPRPLMLGRHLQALGLAPGPVLDDHQPFLEAGLPAVDLIDFLYGSAPGLNDSWHTDADTLDKLSAASLQTIGRVVLRMLAAL